jgi:hypothetical protein
LSEKLGGADLRDLGLLEMVGRLEEQRKLRIDLAAHSLVKLAHHLGAHVVDLDGLEREEAAGLVRLGLVGPGVEGEDGQEEAAIGG